MSSIKKLAYSGLSASLCAVILIVTGYTYYGGVASALMGGIIVLCFSYMTGRRYALMSFLAGGLIALFLCPEKSGVLLYLCITGYYPVVRDKIMKNGSMVRRIIIKILIFVVLSIIFTLLYVLMIGIPSLIYNDNYITVYVIFFCICIVSFVIYDGFLKLFDIRYKNKIISTIKMFMK